MKEYRKPDPWVEKHRLGRHVVAAAVGLVSGIVLMRVHGDFQLYAFFVLIVDFIMWGWLGSRVQPRFRDFIEYVEARAELDGSESWLESVKEEFLDLWAISDLEEMDL